MAGDSATFSPQGFAPQRPSFQLGQHDSKRTAPLTDLQYGHLLNYGVSPTVLRLSSSAHTDPFQFNFVTTPITNDHFRSRVFDLVREHLAALKSSSSDKASTTTPSVADPILPPLTPEDTSLFPSPAVNTYTGFISPWIDLCSPDRIIASISRQVLNLEINYANFCGIRSLVIPGPARDASKNGGNQGLAQYSRAVQEALTVGSRLNFLIHMPMYREPGAGKQTELLSSLDPEAVVDEEPKEVDLFSAWDSWNQIRSVCEYDMRLLVGEFYRTRSQQGYHLTWQPCNYPRSCRK